MQSSPRSWGCFQPNSRTVQLSSVFPTLVGVFPLGRLRLTLPQCLPHARGGVSTTLQDSPDLGAVFPTLVGVFPLEEK